jgi:hypothetical protein
MELVRERRTAYWSVSSSSPAVSVPDTVSQHSGDDDGSGSIAAGGNLNSSQLDETAGDEGGS